MVSGLSITTPEREPNGPAVITVSGDVDWMTHAILERKLEELVDGGETRIVADLSAVGFIDSTGLTVLVSFFHRLKMSGGRLAIVCPSRGVRRVFERTGLDRLLGVVDSGAEARASLAPDAA